MLQTNPEEDLHDLDVGGPRGDLAEDARGLLETADLEAARRTSASQNKRGAPSPAAAAPVPGGMCACFSVPYYQPYFDVDTEEVKQRVMASVYPPMYRQFYEAMTQKPDLYGPMWLCTTLVFVIGASANFASIASFDASEGDIWMYDLTHLTFAGSAVYGFWLLMSAVVWLGLKVMGIAVPYFKLLCMYGYSMSPFIVAAIICVLPFTILQWLVLLAAGVMAAGAIASLVWLLVHEHEQANRARVALGVVLGGHIGFAFLLKFVFF